MPGKKPAKFPWDLAEITRDEARAIKALSTGTASEAQQQIALVLIVKRFAGADDMEFRPDSLGGDRATCFASGKRFVGQMIRRWALATGDEINALPEKF